MKKYIKLLRIKHYIKNLLIFVPLFFSKQLFNLKSFQKILIGFLAFSLSASVVYILNDIKDVAKDKMHPQKCKRPIASGEISIFKAKTVAFLLSAVVITLMCWTRSFVYIIAYIVINVFYSMGLKNVPLIDIVILVSGFLIRILYGCELCNVTVSGWLYLTVISGAFYMALGKRRNELKLYFSTRDVLSKYSFEFLDKNMYMFGALLNGFYSLWALSYDIPGMLWSVPFVMMITLRYSMIIEGKSEGNPVDVLLKDKIIIILILCWAAVVFFNMYFHL